MRLWHSLTYWWFRAIIGILLSCGGHTELMRHCGHHHLHFQAWLTYWQVSSQRKNFRANGYHFTRFQPKSWFLPELCSVRPATAINLHCPVWVTKLSPSPLGGSKNRSYFVWSRSETRIDFSLQLCWLLKHWNYSGAMFYRQVRQLRHSYDWAI
jgi:hypothetical protein